MSNRSWTSVAFLFYLAAMQFNTIVGQGEVKQHLVEMVDNNCLSHALLFLGKEGSGALQLAVALAQFIVCEKARNAREGNPKIESQILFDIPTVGKVITSDNAKSLDSCGKCPSCSKMNQLIHPDVHFTYPVIPRKPGDKPVSTDYITEWREFIKLYPYGNVYDWLQFIGAENKQGNITSSECADIIHKLSLKSFESGYKILILWMPEYLGNEGNKLLKLIEEPPADTLFILVAENESLILSTILSRCQLIKIPALETQEMAVALQERAKIPAEQAQQVAAISEGNYREALQLIQHAEEDWQSLLREWLNAIVKTGPVAQIKWVEETAKLGREKQKQFLRYFNHLLESAIRYNIAGSRDGNQLLIPPQEMDFVLRLNKIADLSQQQAIIEELDKAAYYIERNANAKMLFTALTIKLYHIIADKSLILMS
jgi:DNA polymerase III subunit delta'